MKYEIIFLYTLKRAFSNLEMYTSLFFGFFLAKQPTADIFSFQTLKQTECLKPGRIPKVSASTFFILV